MAISAQQVKELREKTGAGMMNCKKALVESGGDMDAAIKFLREKDLAASGKKAGRVAAEGLIGVCVKDGAAGVVEVNCETDFVAKNAAFQKLVADMADLAAKTDAGDIEAFNASPFGAGKVVDALNEATATIGEKIVVRRFKRHSAGDVFGSYSHGGKIGVVVELKAKKADPAIEALAKDLAMHIASEAPIALSVDDVDAETLKSERDIYKVQAIESGKPEKIVDKIVEGRVKKFLAASVLMEQQFIKDDIKIGDLVSKVAKEVGTDIVVLGYTRYLAGEGIEKKSDDLAAEVAKMTA